MMQAQPAGEPPIIECSTCKHDRPAKWSRKYGRWLKSCVACSEKVITNKRRYQARRAAGEPIRGWGRGRPASEPSPVEITSIPAHRWSCLLCSWEAYLPANLPFTPTRCPKCQSRLLNVEPEEFVRFSRIEKVA